MNSQVQVIAIAGSLAVMFFIFYLIRQRRLREEYALLWFVAGLGLIALSVWRGLLDAVALRIGVAYPPSVLLLGMLVFGLLVAIHYSISLSKLMDQNKRLALEVTLLRHRLDQLGGVGAVAPAAPPVAASADAMSGR